MTKPKRPTDFVRISIKLQRQNYEELKTRKGSLSWEEWINRDDMDELDTIMNGGHA